MSSPPYVRETTMVARRTHRCAGMLAGSILIGQGSARSWRDCLRRVHGVNDELLRSRARTLRDLAEPIGANVYFAPEAQAAYAECGLGVAPGRPSTSAAYL